MKNKLFRKNNQRLMENGQRKTVLSPEGHLSGRAAALSRVARLSSLLLLLFPLLLSAQNGVTVSNLVVNSGTVTFNVSWKNTGMPALWSDSVWVFVDYNKAGRMERLPVMDATVSAGTVEKISGNDKGVRVIGNARSAGSFSAKVQLHTATADLAGVCAYASNYPPVVEYETPTRLEFTGTPPYNLVLINTENPADTIYRVTGSIYDMPDNYVLLSFSDATGIPSGAFVPPPPYAMSSQTWTAGSYVWSDLIAGDFGCAASTNISDGKSTRLYLVADGHYYYSAACVAAAIAPMCPSPWRVPTCSERTALTTIANAFCGVWPNTSEWYDGGIHPLCGFRFALNTSIGGCANALCPCDNLVCDLKDNHGRTVRCVKDA
jgi:hypothetical protein